MKTKWKTDRSTRYRVFLVTFWLEDEGDLAEPDTWRFRMEEPKSGKRRGCVGLEKLVVLLVDEIAGTFVQALSVHRSVLSDENQSISNE